MLIAPIFGGVLAQAAQALFRNAALWAITPSRVCFSHLSFPRPPDFFRFKPHGLCLLFACQKDSVIMHPGYSGKAMRLRGK